MRIPLKITLAAALPLASLLWMTPPADAHDGYGYHRQRPTGAESYRHPYSGRDNAGEQRRGYTSAWPYGTNTQKYNKAMTRLSRQEREAQAKADRRYEGNRSDPRYRGRLAEIDRKYDQKRYQVERNLRND